MAKPGIVFLNLLWLLAACSTPTPRVATPTLPAWPTATLAPTLTLTVSPEPTATATQVIEGGLFSKISRSSTVLHLHCDPLEIIFDVTVKDPKVRSVVFFFRMKDKATGLVTDWASGGNLQSVGNSMYEINFRASTLPDETRYWEAWLQYQFVGIDRAGKSLGQTQIFSEEVTYTPKCP
jgi:hypothetical protein